MLQGGLIDGPSVLIHLVCRLLQKPREEIWSVSNTANEGSHLGDTVPAPLRMCEVNWAVKQRAPVTAFTSDFTLGTQVPEDTKQWAHIEGSTLNTQIFLVEGVDSPCASLLAHQNEMSQTVSGGIISPLNWSP